MHSRRSFLVISAGAGVTISLRTPVFAQDKTGQVEAATAITQVFGGGIRLTAVAIEYTAEVDGSRLNAKSFQVEGRTVTGVFASTSADPANRAGTGRFVIVTLSPEDENAPLVEKVQAQNSGSTVGGGSGPGKAGDIPTYDMIYRQAEAALVQSGPVVLADDGVIAGKASVLTTSGVKNLVVDDFRQLEFRDPDTGRTLSYNLFVPKAYDASKSYPLVLFMHDAGATSDVTRTTLLQGLGAICWASTEDQSERPAFVLAPQFPEIVADDDSRTSNALDTTINLINTLTKDYSIDSGRLYATGQSGGCMMSIAMNIKYPGFFAASFLVAGQWDPALVKPLARQKLWILVSQDDDKAFPGQNAIAAVLEEEGAKISRAVWSGTWSAGEFLAAFEKIDSEGSPINYVSFSKGSVIPPFESAAGASGHRNTWRIAYTIEPIREWIFRQKR